MTDQLAWHRIGTITSATDWVRTVVGFARGYVALGDEHVWFSGDGREWTTVELAVDRSGLEGAPGEFGPWEIASDGNAVVIVAAWDDPDRSVDRGQAISWISEDGVTWRGGVPGGPETAGLEMPWSDGSGGWDASEQADETSAAGPAPITIWHSDDGLTWREHGVLQDGPGEIGLGGGASDAQGRRVVWPGWSACMADGEGVCPDWTAAVATSADGRSWTSADEVPGSGGQVWAGAGPGGTRSRWVLVGQAMTGEGEADPSAWSSTDGRTWTLVSLEIPTSSGDEPAVANASGVTLSDRGYVAAGALEGGMGHETWVSDDGVAWVRLPGGDRTPPDYGPGLVAVGPAGVIGIGDTASDEEYGVWRLGPVRASASPAPTTSGVPPIPSGVAFESESTGTCPTDPGELCSIDEEVVTVSWKAPRTEGVEMRLYGITECFGTDADGAVIDGRCLRRHTELPDESMVLLATTDASTGSATVRLTPSAGGLADTTDGREIYSFVLAAYDDRGRPSVFAIAATGDYCTAADLPCPEE